MDIQKIKISDRDQWLTMRKRDITASDVAALFDRHDYKTLYELYIKKCVLMESEPDNKLFRRGRWLEDGVLAAAIETHPKWKITKAEHYYRDPESRLGGTPDFLIQCRKRGKGVYQAKTIAPSAFRDKWEPEDAPPFWITLQITVEMGLTQRDWGIVGGLVIDPHNLELEEYPVEFNDVVFQKMRKACQEFWQSVDRGEQPAPDFARDHDIIAKVYDRDDWEMLDWTSDASVDDLISRRQEVAKTRKDLTQIQKKLDAELRYRLGNADEAMTDDFEITCKTVKRKASFNPETQSRVIRIKDKRTKSEEQLDD